MLLVRVNIRLSPARVFDNLTKRSTARAKQIVREAGSLLSQRA
jgi:hypothetical protein